MKPFWDRNNLPKYFQKGYDHYRITHLTFEKIIKNQNFVIFPLCVKAAQRVKLGLFAEVNVTDISKYRPENGRIGVQYIRSLSSRSKGLYR